MARPTLEILGDIEHVNKERARLVTEQPAGWRDKYPELQEQVEALAREYSNARRKEETDEWAKGDEH